MKRFLIAIFLIISLYSIGQVKEVIVRVDSLNHPFRIPLQEKQLVRVAIDSTIYVLKHSVTALQTMQTVIDSGWYKVVGRDVPGMIERQKYSDTTTWDATLTDLPYVNVKEYGVTGNGTTDDTDSINACLAAQKGRIHYFPKGTYKISKTINLPAGTTILGEGYHSKITPAAGMAPGSLYVPMVEVDGSAPDSCTTIQNIRIMGNRTNAYLYGWHGGSNSFKNRVLGCWFENFGCVVGGAVDPSNSHDNLIDGNQFLNCEVAIFLTGTSGQYGNIITNNRIFLAKTAGIRGEYPFNTVIANNYIESLYSGIYIIGSYQSKGNVTISGNTIKITGATQYYHAGIHCGYASVTDDPKYFTITGNSIKIEGYGYASGINGVDLKVSTISGNTINAGLYSRAGIYLSGNDSCLNISGNSIENGTNSIVVTSTCNKVNLLSNVCETAIADTGTNTVKSNIVAAGTVLSSGTITHDGQFRIMRTLQIDSVYVDASPDTLLTYSGKTVKKATISSGVLSLDTSNIAFLDQENHFSSDNYFEDTLYLGPAGGVKMYDGGEGILMVENGVQAENTIISPSYLLSDYTEKNYPLTVYASGTPDTITTSYAAMDFGTTDPVLTISRVGTYLIMTRFITDAQNATVGVDTMYYKLYRTNNIPGNISDTETYQVRIAITTNTQTYSQVNSCPQILYTTSNTDDQLTLYTKHTGTVTGGAIVVREASIVAIRLY
jgi:hypothetical protein